MIKVELLQQTQPAKEEKLYVPGREMNGDPVVELTIAQPHEIPSLGSVFPRTTRPFAIFDIKQPASSIVHEPTVISTADAIETHQEEMVPTEHPTSSSVLVFDTSSLVTAANTNDTEAFLAELAKATAIAQQLEGTPDQLITSTGDQIKTFNVHQLTAGKRARAEMAGRLLNHINEWERSLARENIPIGGFQANDTRLAITYEVLHRWKQEYLEIFATELKDSPEMLGIVTNMTTADMPTEALADTVAAHYNKTGTWHALDTKEKPDSVVTRYVKKYNQSENK